MSRRIVKSTDLNSLNKEFFNLERRIGYVQSSNSGGGESVQNITYSALVSAINGSDLVPGKKYRITDYQTVHYILDSDGVQYLDSIITGTLEPLIVTAISDNTTSPVAVSENFPEDIIHYDWNPANWIGDLSFSAETTIITGFKGVIYFRHDTKYDNYMGYDFRNCKFRRWNCTSLNGAWDSETTYNIGSSVQINEGVYYSLLTGNTTEPGGSGQEFWVLLFDLGNFSYFAPAPGFPPQGLDVPDVNDFIDLLTFTPEVYAQGLVRANHFETFRDTEDYWDNRPSILANNIFILNPEYNYYQVYSNKFGFECTDNIYVANGTNSFSNNSFGSFCATNVFQRNFYDNQFSHLCRQNVFGINSNTTLSSFGPMFSQNVCGSIYRSSFLGFFVSNSFKAVDACQFMTQLLANTFVGTMAYNVFQSGITSQQFTALNNLHNSNTGSKNVIRVVDGTPRLTYMDISGTLIVEDPLV